MIPFDPLTLATAIIVGLSVFWAGVAVGVLICRWLVSPITSEEAPL